MYMFLELSMALFYGFSDFKWFVFKILDDIFGTLNYILIKIVQCFQTNCVYTSQKFKLNCKAN